MPELMLSPRLSLATFVATRHEAFRVQQASPPPDVLMNARRFAVDVWEPAWDEFGDLWMESGYRCFGLNEVVQGAPQSAHLFGRAGDMGADAVNIVEAFERVLRQPKVLFDKAILEHKPSKPGDVWMHLQIRAHGAGPPRRLAMQCLDGKTYESFNPKDPRVTALRSV